MKTQTLIAIACLLAATSASGQVYKWKDASGKTVYGDQPPDQGKSQPVKIDSRSYDGPPQIQNWAEVLRRPTQVAGLQPKQPSAGLTMYSAVWCGPCKRAKAYLAEKSISYREVDIDASDANKAEFRSYGGGGIPLFIAGDKSMRGFSPSSLEKLIGAAR